MRIALLTDDAPPRIGGITNYLGGLLRSTTKQVEWKVWSSVPGTDTSSWNCSSEHFDMHRHLGNRYGDNFIISRKFNTLWWHWVKRRWAIKLVREIRDGFFPQIILIARWCEDGHHWCRACQKLSVPYYIIGHGLEFFEKQPRFPWNVPKGLKKDLNKAAHCFANSKATFKAMIERGLPKEKASVLPPGLMLDASLKSDSKNIASPRNEWMNKQFVLCLGRLVYRKGFDLGIDAFELVAKEFSKLHLIIAGEGPEDPKLRRKISLSDVGDRIIMTGKVTDAEKDWLMNNCEVFLMPNRAVKGDMEGFGIVFLEANWAGKPVIGGNNGGVPDAIVNGVTGFCVHSSNINEIVGPLRQILRDESLRELLGEAGRRRVLKKFLWPVLGQRFLKNIRNTCRLSPIPNQ
jgi:phosphatidylinositol alpha-1,6-mannosyltransferase